MYNDLERGFVLFEVIALATFEVAEDGQAVRLKLRERSGQEVAIQLPLSCLTSLIMTLPAIQTQALRAAHQDPSLRVAYPAERWTLERAAEDGCLLLTLMTPDGFQVCFSLDPDAVADMARTVESAGGQAPCEKLH
jgi:hypothetical protein